MIKARIRWCTCRVENILTLGKLLSLWFCFLLHSILFYWASEASPTLGCSIEISRDICIYIIYMYVYMSVCLVCQINCVGGIT